ncbi:MAG: hypothetical protein B9J98_06140 [Candidatus Terraquivivens tikiterensis]|uniref:Uncharacterized protein n=1 Tax=Candidatus Terraquivivens tikiterensis TaxID=1980982 RepID=A0A2R7Y1X1_9ARCH|nr:MAG: hypothetical protein B9J98_06140 [Candidatus Terraquivivens tikiterensis]
MFAPKPEIQDRVDAQSYEALVQKIEDSLTSLSVQVDKLRVRYQNMLSRGKEYFERCIEALVARDGERAKMYAVEIAEIKRLADIVIRCCLVLEQIKVRLETILELKEVMGLMVPLTSIIGAVEKEVSLVVPEASKSLRELVESIEDFTSSSAYVETLQTGSVEVNKDAESILEEARRMAAEQVRKSFPEVPVLTEEERMVYSYIMKCGEELDVARCASELGLDVSQVKATIKNLQEKGLIEVLKAEAT